MTTEATYEAELDEPSRHNEFEAVPVKIINPGDQGANVNPQAADYGAWFNYSVGATDAAKQLLPFDENRSRARVYVNPATVTTTQAASVAAFGTAAAPLADGTVATTATLTAGVWTINWTVSVNGTLGAGDANNMTLELDSGPTTLANSINGSTAGNYAQTPVTVVVPVGGSTISVEAVAGATAGSTYGAQIVATPAPATTTTNAGPVYLGSEAQTKANPPLGFILSAGMNVEVENNQAVWMVPDGTHTATVSVLAERWGESAIPTRGE